MNPTTAPRRAEVVRLREAHPDWSRQRIGDEMGISRQAVHEHLKAHERAKRKARCARGEHGSVTERQHTVWIWGQGPTVVRSAVCNDCGEEVER